LALKDTPPDKKEEISSFSKGSTEERGDGLELIDHFIIFSPVFY
jgi:hypothetical protein